MDLSILPPFAAFFFVDVDFFLARRVRESTSIGDDRFCIHTFTTLLVRYAFMEVLGFVLISKDNSDHTFLHTPNTPNASATLQSVG